MSSNNDDILEKIERFTDGLMSPDEAILFEKEISLDQELKDKVELSILAENLVVFNETAKLKAVMQKDFARQKLVKYIIWASSIASIFVGGFLFWNSKNEKQSDTKKAEINISKQEKVDSKAEIKTEVISSKDSEQKSAANSKTNPSAIVALEKEPVASIEKKDKLETDASKDFNFIETKPIVKNVESDVQILKSTENPKLVDNTKSIKEASQAVDLCDYQLSGLKYSATPSCKGESTGAISILKESIVGGKAPYVFTLDNRQSKTNFANLAASEYILTVKDANGCIKQNKEKLVVKEISCVANKQFIFNPEFDKVWQFPFNESKSPISITVSDESGKVFYKSEIFGLSPSEWNGESNRGMSAKAGVYFYSILYTDDSIEEGTIMISK